jgi:hypothetical protein
MFGPRIPTYDPTARVEHEDGVVLDVLHQQTVLLVVALIG